MTLKKRKTKILLPKEKNKEGKIFEEKEHKN